MLNAFFLLNNWTGNKRIHNKKLYKSDEIFLFVFHFLLLVFCVLLQLNSILNSFFYSWRNRVVFTVSLSDKKTLLCKFAMIKLIP